MWSLRQLTCLNLDEVICELNHNAMKTWRNGGIASHNVNMMLDGGKWSYSCSGDFTSRGSDYGTHLTSWVSPRTSLTEVVKRTALSLVIQPVTARCIN
jgi:hypothetical protein